ncbi:DUF4129 domain-containing protein [bacterium]|nr:DUF4129 domain-containing protein [bacterium]
MTTILTSFLVFFAAGVSTEVEPVSVITSPVEAKRIADRVMQQPIYHRWELRQKRVESSGTLEETTWSKRAELLQNWLLDHTQWIGKVWEWIVDWWNSWFERPQKSGGSGSGGGFGSFLHWAGWLLVAVVVGSLLILLYRLWMTTRLEGKQAKVLSRRQIRDALQSGEALAMSSSDWLAEGEKWGNEQDRRLVFRALYLGLLSGLHQQGRIDFRRNRTNWVYVSRFRGSEDLRDEFASLTSLFDEVWYGGIESSEQNIDPVKAQVKRLLEAGPSHA